MKEKYTIKYEVILDGGLKIVDKEIKINNCQSSIEAQIKLEDYLKRHNANFKQLIVFSCKLTPDLGNLTGDFGNVMDQFNDLFGKNKNFFGGK